MSLSHLRETLRPYVELDRRSLALMRILTASIVLYDLVSRLFNLSAHYGTLSVMPPEALGEAGNGQAWFPFLPQLLEAVPQLPLILIIAALISVSLVLVGYQTRFNTLISWILLLAIQSMNLFVLSGADSMIRLIFFFGMFLPWGDFFSIDRVRGCVEGISTRIASVWTFALLLQISYIYFFAALLKSTGIDWQDGSAVYYALSTDMVTPLGAALARADLLLPFLTQIVRLFQLAIPFLFFFPIKTNFIRTSAATLLIVMHVAFALCLHLDTFSYISIALLSCVLPTAFWQLLRNWQNDWPRAQAIGQQIYRYLGTHLSRAHVPRIPQHLRVASVSAALVFIVSISVWNAGNVVNVPRPAIFTKVMQAAGISQYWGLFAPIPRRLNYTYVADGTTQAGETVRVFDMPHPYTDERWRKYVQDISANENSSYRRYFLSYICTKWNASHEGPERLASVSLFFVFTETLPDYQTSSKKILRYASASCDEEEGA